MCEMSLIQIRGEVNVKLVESIEADPSIYKFFLTNTERILMVPITWEDVKNTNLTQWLTQEDDAIIVVVPTDNAATLFYIYSLLGDNYRAVADDTHNIVRMLDDENLNSKFFESFKILLSFDGKIDTSQQCKVPTIISKYYELCDYLIQPKYCVDLLGYDIKKIYDQSSLKERSKIMLCLYIYARSLLSLEDNLWLTDEFERLPVYSRELIGPYTPVDKHTHIKTTKYNLLANSYYDINEIIKGKIEQHEHKKIIKTLLDENFGVLVGQMVYTSMYSGIGESKLHTSILLEKGKTIYDVIDRLDTPIQIIVSRHDNVRTIKFMGKSELKVYESFDIFEAPCTKCYYKDKLYMRPSCMFSLLTGGIQVPLKEYQGESGLGWRFLATEETSSTEPIKTLYGVGVTSFTKDEFDNINLNL